MNRYTTDPFADALVADARYRQKKEAAWIPAAAGAAVGGLAGYATADKDATGGDKAKRVLMGGALGGAIGYGAGHFAGIGAPKPAAPAATAPAAPHPAPAPVTTPPVTTPPGANAHVGAVPNAGTAGAFTPNPNIHTPPPNTAAHGAPTVSQPSPSVTTPPPNPTTSIVPYVAPPTRAVHTTPDGQTIIDVPGRVVRSTPAATPPAAPQQQQQQRSLFDRLFGRNKPQTPYEPVALDTEALEDRFVNSPRATGRFGGGNSQVAAEQRAASLERAGKLHDEMVNSEAARRAMPKLEDRQAAFERKLQEYERELDRAPAQMRTRDNPHFDSTDPNAPPFAGRQIPASIADGVAGNFYHPQSDAPSLIRDMLDTDAGVGFVNSHAKNYIKQGLMTEDNYRALLKDHYTRITGDPARAEQMLETVKLSSLRARLAQIKTAALARQRSEEEPRSGLRDALLVGAGTATGAGIGYGAAALLKHRYGDAWKGLPPETRIKLLGPIGAGTGTLAGLVHVLRQREEARMAREQQERGARK